ncbi:MAG: hypothetical protein LIP09_16655 [Bacteroidales bacterium]|nr:hypothetical protein [Bacteroidales bacterium]
MSSKFVSKPDATQLTFSLYKDCAITTNYDSVVVMIYNLYFRNLFNVWEIANFPHTTTIKTEVERSLFVLGHKSQHHNQRVAKSYEVQSANLTSDEAVWLDQLFSSHDTMRLVPNDFSETDPYSLLPVLITDITFEVSDSDEKPNIVKFAWRYADNRPLVRLSSSPGIFTNHYNYSFS